MVVSHLHKHALAQVRWHDIACAKPDLHCIWYILWYGVVQCGMVCGMSGLAHANIEYGCHSYCIRGRLPKHAHGYECGTILVGKSLDVGFKMKCLLCVSSKVNLGQVERALKSISLVYYDVPKTLTCLQIQT